MIFKKNNNQSSSDEKFVVNEDIEVVSITADNEEIPVNLYAASKVETKVKEQPQKKAEKTEAAENPKVEEKVVTPAPKTQPEVVKGTKTVNNIDNVISEVKEKKHRRKSKDKGYYYNRYYENTRLISNGKTNKVPFAVVEAYKNIRIHLMSALAKENGKVIAFSSPNASEGKSTTSVNIAITLSQLNKKVVLVDADVRRATVNKKLHLENNLGCTDVLVGNSTLEEALQSFNASLDILTSGSVAENPSELFSSTAFDRLLSELREKYDYVIIDTPPVNLVSDTLAIAQKCDGLVIIARAAVTTYASFKSAVATIKQLNINLIGTIINGSGASRKKYRSYYRYSKYGYSKYAYYK